MISKLIVSDSAEANIDSQCITVRSEQFVQFVCQMLKPETLDSVEGAITYQGQEDQKESHEFLKSLFLVLKPSGQVTLKLTTPDLE